MGRGDPSQFDGVLRRTSDSSTGRLVVELLVDIDLVSEAKVFAGLRSVLDETGQGGQLVLVVRGRFVDVRGLDVLNRIAQRAAATRRAFAVAEPSRSLLVLHRLLGSQLGLPIVEGCSVARGRNSSD